MTSIASIYRHRGLEFDPDQYDQMKAERRARNVANAKEVLTKNQIEFVVTGSGPDGVAMRVGEIAYWPEVGRWILKGGSVRYGLRNLVKYLKNGEII